MRVLRLRTMCVKCLSEGGVRQREESVVATLLRQLSRSEHRSMHPVDCSKGDPVPTGRWMLPYLPLANRGRRHIQQISEFPLGHPCSGSQLPDLKGEPVLWHVRNPNIVPSTRTWMIEGNGSNRTIHTLSFNFSFSCKGVK